MSTPYDPSGSDKDPGQGPAPGQQYGQGYGPGGPPAGQRTNTLAVAALVSGIVSVTLGWCCVLFALPGPVAVVLGKQAQQRADRSGGQVGGRGMATAGFILGIIGTLVLLIGIGWIIYVVSSGEGFSYRFGTTDGVSS